MSPHRHNKKNASSDRSKIVFRWVAIVLIVLLIFWLVIAEDIGAYIGWGNP